jgi:hypothetical protein
MKTGKTMQLSDRALEILRAATINDRGLLVLPGPPESGAMHREITKALTALGWVWDRRERAFTPVPDPVAALANALKTGEVPL